MTVTLELSTELDGRLERAKARGYSLADLLRVGLDRVTTEQMQSSLEHSTELSTVESVRLLRLWGSKYAVQGVSLADDAMSRETIYGERA